MMTRAQFSVQVAQQRATFVVKKDGIEWWRLPDGRWLGAREADRGMVQVKQFAAGACSCG